MYFANTEVIGCLLAYFLLIWSIGSIVFLDTIIVVEWVGGWGWSVVDWLVGWGWSVVDWLVGWVGGWVDRERGKVGGGHISCNYCNLSFSCIDLEAI